MFSYGNPQGEVRFSTRRATKVQNYNEDDDNALDEDDLAMDTAQDNTLYADDMYPVIDSVLKHRLKEGKGNRPVRVNPCDIWLTVLTR